MKKLNVLLLAGLFALPIVAKADDMQQPGTTSSAPAHKKNVSTHRHKKHAKKKSSASSNSAGMNSSTSLDNTSNAPASTEVK